MTANTLFYGDNLDVLRRHVADASVDLVYLDPPFNSNQNYNVLFAEQDGTRAGAQIKAFADTWRWDQSSALAFQELIEGGPERVAGIMAAFRAFLGESDMMAYLAMMAPRLVELHRALKPTGSLYLHCDPTASHYLKLLLDAVFGPENFRNEIIWKRTHAHGSAKRFGPVHDTILLYTKTDQYLWTSPKAQHDPDYLRKHFTGVDHETNRRFQPITLTDAGVRHGDSGRPWRGIDPTSSSRHWAIPGAVLERLNLSGATVQEKLDALDSAGRIHWPAKADGKPRLKWFEDELEGVALPDVWTDVAPLGAQATERLGYPTQKPEALLERIINASSNPGDVVLDPFCGCGTAIAAAQKLGRRWIGIDITHLAINLIKYRLHDSFGDEVEYEVIGEPTDLSGAEALAGQDRYQFQYWALGLVDARPVEEKKGADRGIDGRLRFLDDGTGRPKQVILSVKSGNVGVRDVRELGNVVDREKAEIGVLITLNEPTGPMRKEAAGMGFYASPWGKHPRLQILTIEQLLDGARIDSPRTSGANVTFKRAGRAKKQTVETLSLLPEE